jgi:hypothetical protein
MARKHWSEILFCHLCGKRFRSMSAEAYHRHNARFVCKGYFREEFWKEREQENIDACYSNGEQDF